MSPRTLDYRAGRARILVSPPIRFRIKWAGDLGTRSRIIWPILVSALVPVSCPGKFLYSSNDRLGRLNVQCDQSITVFAREDPGARFEHRQNLALALRDFQ